MRASSTLQDDKSLEHDLRLAGPALSIRGRVRGPDGSPLADAVVALWRVARIPGAGFAENLAVADDVKSHKLGIAPRRVYAVTGTDGAFVLGGLGDREYTLRVIHREHLALTSEPIQARATGVDLRYPRDQFRTVRCRVVNMAGEPMPGLRIDTCVQSSATKTSSIWDLADDKRTDKKGEIEFERILRHEATQVRVRGENIIAAFHMIEPPAPDVCEIVVERQCHFRIESADPKWADADVSLETDEGKVVWISWSRGTYNQTLRLVKGRSAVVTASERATTLVVGEKKRVPVKLIPGEVVVVRF